MQCFVYTGSVNIFRKQILRFVVEKGSLAQAGLRLAESDLELLNFGCHHA